MVVVVVVVVVVVETVVVVVVVVVVGLSVSKTLFLFELGVKLQSNPSYVQ